MPRAGYIAQPHHLTTQQAQLVGNAVLVCNPAIDTTALCKVADLGTTLLYSFNATMIASTGVGNAFYDSMRAAVAPYGLTHNGAPVVSSDGWSNQYFDWRILQGALTYAAWILANVPADLYLDDLTKTIPQHKLNDLPDPSVANSYPAWRTAFVGELRRLAPRKIIVGNTAGFTDTRLNGICIEEYWRDQMTPLIALSHYTWLWTWGRKPTVNIDWAGDWDFPEMGIYRGEFFTTE
jgi:hypothetical protein